MHSSWGLGRGSALSLAWLLPHPVDRCSDSGPSHNPPRHNPHPHTPVLCISQKPPLSCSAKNPGLAESCGGPLECRFPVPAPVCQPRQRPRGRMGDHRILSGMGRLAAMSHRGGLVCLPHLRWGTPHTGAALNCWPALSLPSLQEWGSWFPSNSAPPSHSSLQLPTPTVPLGLHLNPVGGEGR